jgi:hypothetical protein
MILRLGGELMIKSVFLSSLFSHRLAVNFQHGGCFMTFSYVLRIMIIYKNWFFKHFENRQCGNLEIDKRKGQLTRGSRMGTTSTFLSEQCFNPM